MSSSSFGTVIGTPRDQIPKLPISNYADSSPDLTASVEERNEEHKEDLKDLFASVTEIETLRHNNLWDNMVRKRFLLVLLLFIKSVKLIRSQEKQLKDTKVLIRKNYKDLTINLLIYQN